jgi:hypothetical protein
LLEILKARKVVWTGIKVSGGTVYVAGNVKDRTFMLSSNVQASYGLDDVFVARVNKDNGEVFWTSQIGSASKERLAAHGGLAVHSNGNVLLYGSTTGSLFREKQEAHTNIFAVTVDHGDGSIANSEARPDMPNEAQVSFRDNAPISEGELPPGENKPLPIGNVPVPLLIDNNFVPFGMQLEGP